VRHPAAVAVASGAVGAAAVAGVATGLRRRGGSGAQTHAVTVLAPLDVVREAWEAQARGDGPGGRADLRPAPGDRGTELRVTTEGSDGDTRAALRRLKSRVEAGDVLTTDGQPTARTERQEAATRAVTDRLRSWSPA
jgi:hypothetical protein